MEAIHHPLTDPAVKSLINIHCPTVHWTVLSNPLHNVMQKVKTHCLHSMIIENVVSLLGHNLTSHGVLSCFLIGSRSHLY